MNFVILIGFIILALTVVIGFLIDPIYKKSDVSILQIITILLIVFVCSFDILLGGA